jgi:hypothetical protein
MPAIIDSAPDCITSISGAKPPDDSADFILQEAYKECAGIMTFGPGTTYGEGAHSAATAYYVLTWIGIVFMVVVIVAWVAYENRRLLRHALRIEARTAAAAEAPGAGPAAGVIRPDPEAGPGQR